MKRFRVLVRGKYIDQLVKVDILKSLLVYYLLIFFIIKYRDIIKP